MDRHYRWRFTAYYFTINPLRSLDLNKIDFVRFRARQDAITVNQSFSLGRTYISFHTDVLNSRGLKTVKRRFNLLSLAASISAPYEPQNFARMRPECFSWFIPGAISIAIHRSGQMGNHHENDVVIPNCGHPKRSASYLKVTVGSLISNDLSSSLLLFGETENGDVHDTPAVSSGRAMKRGDEKILFVVPLVVFTRV